MAKNAIGLAIATEEYGAKFFANGAAPSGVLEHPGTIKDPQRVKIGEDHKLYVPPYTLPAAEAAALGGVLLAANQAASTAMELSGLVTEFNTLLAALKAAGIMAADE